MFSEIESVAGKDIRPFLQTYFDSPSEIPYAEMFAKIGWKYIEEDSVQGFSFSGVRARMDGSNLILNVRKEDNILGAKQGDTVIEVNDMKVDQSRFISWRRCLEALDRSLSAISVAADSPFIARREPPLATKCQVVSMRRGSGATARATT